MFGVFWGEFGLLVTVELVSWVGWFWLGWGGFGLWVGC